MELNHNCITTLQGMNSALSVACKAGHTEAARVLVNAGADVNTANEVRIDNILRCSFRTAYEPFYVILVQDGQTSLHVAASGGYEAIATLLLDHGAAIDAMDKVTCMYGTFTQLKFNLNLACFYDVWGVYQENETPLFIAAYNNVHYRMIVSLLNRGANPNNRSIVSILFVATIGAFCIGDAYNSFRRREVLR